MNITSDKLKLPMPCCPHQCLHDMRKFHMPLEAAIADPGTLCKLGRACYCRSVTGVAGAGAGSQHIYSVGTDAMACTIDALNGKLQQQFEAGKHALTCVKAASG